MQPAKETKWATLQYDYKVDIPAVMWVVPIRRLVGQG
jgi:hypothetical protein